MDFYIIPILLGNNMDTLFGIKNDLFIIYNLFYKYYLLYPNKWHKPFILINKNTSLNNIKNIIINFNNFEAKNIFIIYFSGHSSSKGYLKFYNENINSSILLDCFNKHLTNSSQIYFIMDSCYSKIFIQNIIKYKNIEKIYFMGSCMENEHSKEIETDYDDKLFKYKLIKPSKKIVVSIFSFYFVKLLMIRNINNYQDFKNIINDKLWKMISIKYKQTIYYEEL
jgi:hypothetical protein